MSNFKIKKKKNEKLEVRDSTTLDKKHKEISQSLRDQRESLPSKKKSIEKLKIELDLISRNKVKFTDEDLQLKADILIIVGTSMQVYPAASLINYVPLNTKVYYIDPTPAEINYSNLIVVEERATTGILKVKNDLVEKINKRKIK